MVISLFFVICSAAWGGWDMVFNHLREQKLDLLLFVCGITSLLAFFVAAMSFLL